MADRDGFASPHQLRAADAEVPPSSSRQVGRFAVLRAVPPFHRQDAEAVADAHAVDLNRLRERAGRVDGVVKLKCDVRAFEVGAEAPPRVFSDATLGYWLRLTAEILSLVERLVVFLVLVSTAENAAPEPALLFRLVSRIGRRDDVRRSLRDAATTAASAD